jgi:hypothetical protein
MSCVVGHYCPRRHCHFAHMSLTSADTPLRSPDRPTTSHAALQARSAPCTAAGVVGDALRGFGAPRLGASRLGASRLGAPRLGAPRLGAPRLGTPRLGTPRPPWGRRPHIHCPAWAGELGRHAQSLWITVSGRASEFIPPWRRGAVRFPPFADGGRLAGRYAWAGGDIVALSLPLPLPLPPPPPLPLPPLPLPLPAAAAAAGWLELAGCSRGPGFVGRVRETRAVIRGGGRRT